MISITCVVPFYRNPSMLRVHLHKWLQEYSPAVHAKMKLLIVDDGSPEPALGGPDAPFRCELRNIGARLLRIGVDIPWNRGGARNLGSTIAETPWLLHMDIDHILPPDSAERLAAGIDSFPTDRWYRFPRYRVGAADETRNKDAIPRDQKFGEIKPHGDSYLVRKDLYWCVGGYDEDYSGCLGGGSPFTKQLEKAARCEVLEPLIPLHVYTRDACFDASDLTLSRDTSEYSRRRKMKERTGKTKAQNPLRFPWAEIPL